FPVPPQGSPNLLDPSRCTRGFPGRNACPAPPGAGTSAPGPNPGFPRSEEHTSELQSRENLVCRLLLEKKKTMRLLTLFISSLFCVVTLSRSFTATAPPYNSSLSLHDALPISFQFPLKGLPIFLILHDAPEGFPEGTLVQLPPVQGHQRLGPIQAF